MNKQNRPGSAGAVLAYCVDLHYIICKRQRMGKSFVFLQNEKIFLLVDKILSSKNILWFIIQAPAQTQKLKTEDYGIPRDPGTYKLETCTCVSTK